MKFKEYYESQENGDKRELRLNIIEKCGFKSKQTFYSKKDNNYFNKLEKELISQLIGLAICELFPEKSLLTGIVTNAFSCYLRSTLYNKDFENLHKHLKISKEYLKIIIETPELITSEQLYILTDIINKGNLQKIYAYELYEQFNCGKNTINEDTIKALKKVLPKLK